MTNDEYQAFWSYAHSDNDRTNGRVLALAEAISDEFALCAGDELELFLDRRELGWGDLWRDRIDSALGQVPFFIAIITPKFLSSAECRRELLAFSRESKSRGIDKLLLPILYVDVPGLSTESDDEVIALIARTQYVNWTSLRLKSSDDPVVLEAVHALALRLISLREDVVGTALEIERKTDGDNVFDLKEAIDEIESRLGVWMDSVEFDAVAGRKWTASIDERLGRIKRLQRTTGQAGAILSVLQRLGLDLYPIAEQRLEAAKAYAKLTIELDPYVTSAIRGIARHPEFAQLLGSLRDGVAEAYRNISSSEDGQGSYSMPQGISDQSRHIRDANSAMEASMVYVNEANEIVMRWRERLVELDDLAESAA